MSTEGRMRCCCQTEYFIFTFLLSFPQYLSPFFLFLSFYHYYYSHFYSIPFTYICAQAETSSFHPLPGEENDRSKEIIIRKKKKKKRSIHSSRMEKRYEKGSGMVYWLVRRRRDSEYLVAMATGANYFSVFRPCGASSNFTPFLLPPSLSFSLSLDLRPEFLSTGGREGRGATFLPLCRILSGTPTPFVVHTRQPFAQH